MRTIFSTLLNNILPDAGQFYSSREVSSQTLLMFHVIVDIFLKMEFSLHHLLTPTKQVLGADYMEQASPANLASPITIKSHINFEFQLHGSSANPLCQESWLSQLSWPG